MTVVAPVHSALPAAPAAPVRPGGPAERAIEAALPSALEPVDLVSLSPVATRHLALAPPTEALRQLGGLLHDAQEIEQLVRTPPAAAMGELAVEIATAADALATQLPRPVEPPGSPDTRTGGHQPGTPHPEPHGYAALAADHDPGQGLGNIAGREQQLREEAATMLGRATDTLERMQQHLQGTPPGEAGGAARIAASAMQVARARQRLQDGPSPSPEWLRPRPLLLTAMALVTVAGLCWASRLDLHVARELAGGAVGLCLAVWSAGWLAGLVRRRRPGRRTMRIELRR